MKAIKIIALNQKTKEILLKKDAKLPKITKQFFRILKWDEEIVAEEPLTILVYFRRASATTGLLINTLYIHLQERLNKEQLIENTDYNIDIVDIEK